MKSIDFLSLKNFLLKCDYTEQDLKYIYDNFGRKQELCILRQIYAALGMLSDDENEYMQAFKFLKKEFDLKGNILEIGGGNYPVLASYIDSYQKQIGKGNITVIDPNLSIKHLGNIKLIKDKFMFGDDVESYDLIISQSPCLKIDEVSAAAIEKRKEFFVTLCNCILERYPNLVDYYFEDESFDPIFEQLRVEMCDYNKTVNQSDFIINNGTIFYGVNENIRFYTGKKLIKQKKCDKLMSSEVNI